MSPYGWRVALAVELRKACAARVMLGVTVALAVGIPLLSLLMIAAARGGRQDVLAKLGPLGAQPGWAGYLAVAAQITGAAAVLGFGVALSWLFGREFAEGTITGLFGLPVTRSAVALAKLGTYAIWAALVAVAGVGLLLAGGVALGLGAPDVPAWASLAREWVLIVGSAMIAVPVGWVASLTRGLVGGIAAAVGLIVAAQVAVVGTTAAGWFPIVAPALWAMAPDSVSALQLSLVILVPAGFGLATMITWHRLQLDR